MSDNNFTGINLRRDICCFIGPPDSGKSNLVKFMLSLNQYRRHLVYDPLHGFDSKQYNVIRPPSEDYKWRRYEEGNPELNRAVDQFILDAPPEQRPAFLAIDEAARLLPLHQEEGPAMGNLNDFNAHIDLADNQGLSLWLICQRFAQLNSDLENKATHYFVMGYGGKNDKDALDRVHEDLTDMLMQTKEFGFVYVGPNGMIRKFDPVEKMGEKAKI